MTPGALNSTFAALVNPTRRAILTRLLERPMTVTELREPFALSAPAISRHLKVLTDADLVRREVDRQHRIYSLRDGALDEAAQWLERHRRDWSRQFDALEAQLRARTDDDG